MLITVREFFELHSTLSLIVEKELGTPAPVPETVKEILVRGAAEDPVSGSILAWIGLLDLAVNPHLLRSHMKRQGADEAVIRAFLRFLVSRTAHSQTDRDKIDWLATYLFQSREERTKVPTGWPKSEVERILLGFEFPALAAETSDLLADLSSLLEEIRYFEKFTEITDSRIIQRGRDMKNRFGEVFFHPDVLAATINYNLIFGKKFHSLLQQTMEQVSDFASQIETGSVVSHDQLHKDYHGNADALRHLSELGRKHQAAKPAGATKAAAGSIDPKERMRELGIKVSAETLALKKRINEIALRLKANPTMNSLPGTWSALPLAEWESNSFRAGYPDSEQSFRADFARAVSYAIAILSLIDEELAAYQGRKESEFLWKKHYDTLLFLLQEGREHKDELVRLAAATEKKGLADKAKQLRDTAAKLESGLSGVAGIFAK